MMKSYKIKHIPTGLYYRPKVGHFSGDQTHLSERGKVYSKIQPTPSSRVAVSDSQVKKYNLIDAKHSEYSYDKTQKYLEAKKTDWALEIYELTKTGEAEFAKG